ncbi:MAG: metallophosphoesterase [Acidimicrobiales bacterium]
MIGLTAGPVVFAVEDTSAQVSWRSVPSGPVTVECHGARVVAEGDGGPGVVDLTGLTPATAYTARVTVGAEVVAELPFRTLPTPPGEELFRFATVGDVHLGQLAFGLRRRLTEPDAVVPHPLRCVRAAATALVAWGARRLVVKGDFVNANTDEHWAMASEFVQSLPIPWDVVPGNHELAHGHDRPFERAAAAGIDMVRDVRPIDVDGLRLVLVNSASEEVEIGRLHHLSEPVSEAAATAEGAAMVLVHHQPQLPHVPLHLPRGVGALAARRFARELRAANPASMGSSGHTHRYRRLDLAGLPWTEVGSPKDFPGAWAGYVVHEGGIRQVVRRVDDRDCLAWLDHTRHAALGAWGLWSPGRLSDRCFTYEWPVRRRAGSARGGRS